jgi:hypothetical protein
MVGSKVYRAGVGPRAIKVDRDDSAFLCRLFHRTGKSVAR